MWCALSVVLPQKGIRWPLFLFHDFKKKSASFQWEKNWHKSMLSFFFTVLLNCTDWKKKSLYVRIGLAFMGQIARVKIKSTLERKVKTKAKKGIFLVLKWINNTFDSNSVQCHMHHRKNLTSIFGVFVCIVTSKQAQWPPFFITFFIIFLTCYTSVPSFIYNHVRFFYYGITLSC